VPAAIMDLSLGSHRTPAIFNRTSDLVTISFPLDSRHLLNSIDGPGRNSNPSICLRGTKIRTGPQAARNNWQEYKISQRNNKAKFAQRAPKESDAKD